MDDGNKFERPTHPRESANIFEIITFSWLLRLFKKGRKKDLETNDLYRHLNDHSSSSLGNNLEEKWRQELTNAKNANRSPSLLRALANMFGMKIMFVGLILSFSEIILKMCQPIMIGGLLSNFNSDVSKHTDLINAYFYVFGLTICMLGSKIILHSTLIEMTHFGMKFRVASCAAIYRKTLRMSRTALDETQAGQILNILSNDVSRFDTMMFYLHYLWIGPLQTIVVTYFLWKEIGASSLLGLFVMVMFIPLQGWLGKKSSEFRLKTSLRTDERVRLMNEIISGIQVVKMYTWEKSFAYLVRLARKMEVQQVKGSSYVRAVLTTYTSFLTKIAIFFSIMSYVLLGNNINTHKVFIVTSYYNLLQFTMATFFQQGIAFTAETLITIKRLQDFLLYEDKDVQIILPSEADKVNEAKSDCTSNGRSKDNETLSPKQIGIIMSNVTAKWSDGQINNSLENINLFVRPGQLLAIVGPVGAGKSSLMHAILRELPLSRGNISVRGVISYASQEPWLFTGSVRQNILFGLPMDAERYEQVIQACALIKDFKQLPFGDRTTVGEKGVSLSGGQRARINLARAIYKQADIYLLDDPLSAVDTHVGRHLFEKCIKGFLRGKICILITHQVRYLKNVDQIIVMENANILMEGTYNEIQGSNLDFSKVFLSSVETTNVFDHESNNGDCGEDPKYIRDHRTSICSSTLSNDKIKIDDDQQKPIEVLESRSLGNVSFSIYLAYLFAGGRKLKIIFFILICILAQVLISSGDLCITYCWLLRLFKKGRKKDLETNDLYRHLNDHSSSSLGNNLEEKWRQELTNAKNANRSPSLLRALAKMFGMKIMFVGLILSFGEIILKMCQPIMIGGLLSNFNSDVSKHTDLINAYFYVFGLTICMLGTKFILHSTVLEMTHFGMKFRVASCAAIYRKTLRMSRTALDETQAGQILNILSNDVSRFDTTMFYLHYLWIGPLQTIVVTYFLWKEIGASSLLGLFVMVMFIPLQGWLGKKSSEFRLKTSLRTDERVRLMNEIISGIQVVKMYTWEKSFAYLVRLARKMEVQQVKGSSYVRAVLTTYTAFLTRIAIFFSIMSYVLLGNSINTQKVFIVTSYYNLLQFTMATFFPQGIAFTAEMLVTIKRLQDFLLYEDKDVQFILPSEADKVNETKSDCTSNGRSKNNETLSPKQIGIIMSNVTAKWSDGQINNSLENINLFVRPGQLLAIVGPVGAGKSSLMHAILRELPLSRGNISVRGVISYASQEPWLFTGSVRQNILFGLPMDAERYEQVIQACALIKDFKQLPFGDRTTVGEKGVSLSGGQRARINLARAIYKQADIYLLDDPLSAVDTHVGRHLFEKCIKGFLRGKICILITHQVRYLKNVDQIIVMENANILMEGTYNEIQGSNLDFSKVFLSSVETTNVFDHESNNGDCGEDPKYIRDHRTSISSSTLSNDKIKIDDDQQKPIEVLESRSLGNVSFSVYLAYLFAGGRKLKIIFFILICILAQVLISSGDLCITYWVKLEDHVFSSVSTSSGNYSSETLLWWPVSRKTCYTVYTIIISLMVLAIAVRSAMFVSVTTTASINLHDRMFNALTRATLYFFNTNSSGRILNRFSKDIGSIDEILPVILNDCIHLSLLILGIICIIGFINFYLLIPSVVFAFVFNNLTHIYLSTSRSIKRLEGITRSPIFAHLNATLHGLTTIRAFKAEQILSREFDNHQDLHSSTWYLFITSSRAFGLWLDIICLIYVTIITFSIIAFMDNDVFGGNIGLAITQATGLIDNMQWVIRQSTELENQMTSVERVLEYTNVPLEAPLESTLDKLPPSNWPSNGKITFKNFYLRYAPDSHYVLNNLNLNIEPMQKIGIVGRTGAGKSSMIAALFRLAVNEGKILIDGIDIQGLGLHTLRSKISIIPQEPILFSGKLRKNLDPFDEYSDHALWNALDEVELKSIVDDLPDGLNSKMSESGSNFSVGQRQLLCLARAIVRNNKILVLDEATANVDPQTDSLIQQTIRNKFRNSTVLTIAHRLDTVMDSDKIIVMDAGAIVEFDHPYNLLKNNDGFLYKMVEQTGSITAELLHKMSADSYFSLSRL